MAKKVHKKPRHTKLVVPSKKPKEQQELPVTDRMGRVAPGAEAASYKRVPPQEEMAKAQKEERTSWLPWKRKQQPNAIAAAKEAASIEEGVTVVQEGAEEALPGNAIVLPRGGARFAAARRRKLWRRIRVLMVVAVLLAALVFYFSGVYVTVAMRMGEAFESLRIAVQPGDGFPMDFSIAGFIKAESMEKSGFAALGSTDMIMVSSTGQKLRSVQHGYVNPGMSVGKTRACVYARGGREYVVEGRDKRLAYRTLEHEILFAEMSPDGRLLVATSAQVQVYGPTYETDTPDFKMSMSGEKPVMAAFHTDNRTFALGCLSADGGALGTTLYLLRTDRNVVQASIRADDARLLQLHITKTQQVLAIFDTFAALYDGKGAQLFRYDYADRQLLAADYLAGRTVLCFGSESGEKVETVMLDESLLPLFSTANESDASPRVLLSEKGLFLLLGQEVMAYDSAGALADAQVLEAKVYGLVRGGQPLVITAEEVAPLEGMLETEKASSSPSVADTSVSA